MPPQVTLKTVWALVVAGLLGLLLIGFGVQTARIEGFKVWPISVKGYKAENKSLKDQLDKLVAAQATAGNAQKQVNDNAAKTYKDITKGVDYDAHKTLPVELGAAERYAAAHRVRTPRGGGAPGYAAPSASGDGPRDTQAAGTTSQLDDASGGGTFIPGVVIVSDADLKICTINTVKAEAGHDFATKLEAATQEKQP